MPRRPRGAGAATAPCGSGASASILSHGNGDSGGEASETPPLQESALPGVGVEPQGPPGACPAASVPARFREAPQPFLLVGGARPSSQFFETLGLLKGFAEAIGFGEETRCLWACTLLPP